MIVDPQPFTKLDADEWQAWITAYITRAPLKPYLPGPRDTEPQHAIRDLYVALPDESRGSLLQGLHLALSSTPVLPSDTRTVMRFFYLFHLIALVKPPESRHFVRMLLKSEVFADTVAGQTNMHCLLLGVCAKYGVDSQLIRDLHSGTQRIRGHEYPLACFRTLALAMQDASEACRFLDYIVPQLGRDDVVPKLQSNLELCARLSGLAAIDSWYAKSEPVLLDSAPMELAILEKCLTQLIYAAPLNDALTALQMQKTIFSKYGAESLFALVASRSTDPRGCVKLLVSLYHAGLRWSWIDISSLRFHKKIFKGTETALCIGRSDYAFDPHENVAVFGILAGAADSIQSLAQGSPMSLTTETKQLSVSLRPDMLVI